MTTPNWSRELERCREIQTGTVARQCVKPTGHTGAHQYVVSSDNALVMHEARRLFLQGTCGWRDGRSVMIARSYVEEKIDFAFSAEDIWYLRSVLDDERRAEFDKALIKWGDDHGL